MLLSEHLILYFVIAVPTRLAPGAMWTQGTAPAPTCASPTPSIGSSGPTRRAQHQRSTVGSVAVAGAMGDQDLVMADPDLEVVALDTADLDLVGALDTGDLDRVVASDMASMLVAGLGS